MVNLVPTSGTGDLTPTGGDDGTRTHDPLLAKQVLSPAELRPRAGPG